MDRPADLHPCPLARRLAAMVYDGLVLAGLLMIGAALVVIPTGRAVDQGEPIFQLYLVLITFGYLAGSWRLAGQTVGMRAWRIRLIADAGRPSLRALSVRFLVSMVSLAALGAGFWWSLLRHDRATWHDLASHTRLGIEVADPGRADRQPRRSNR